MPHTLNVFFTQPAPMRLRQARASGQAGNGTGLPMAHSTTTLPVRHAEANEGQHWCRAYAWWSRARAHAHRYRDRTRLYSSMTCLCSGYMFSSVASKGYRSGPGPRRVATTDCELASEARAAHTRALEAAVRDYYICTSEPLRWPLIPPAVPQLPVTRAARKRAGMRPREGHHGDADAQPPARCARVRTRSSPGTFPRSRRTPIGCCEHGGGGAGESVSVSAARGVEACMDGTHRV